MPTTAAGTHPMTTMPHKRQVLRRSSGVFVRAKGLSFEKYRMMTAMMAPIWMTTRKSARNSGVTSSFTNSSTRIMCPVDDTGSHSVRPSTTPMSSALSASSAIMDTVSFRLEARRKRAWFGREFSVDMIRA